jgi:hypothetical protein
VNKYDRYGRKEAVMVQPKAITQTLAQSDWRDRERLKKREEDSTDPEKSQTGPSPKCLVRGYME